MFYATTHVHKQNNAVLVVEEHPLDAMGIYLLKQAEIDNNNHINAWYNSPIYNILTYGGSGIYKKIILYMPVTSKGLTTKQKCALFWKYKIWLSMYQQFILGSW